MKRTENECVWTVLKNDIKELAEKETKVIFGGRLGEYKYYDMDAVIDAALTMAAAQNG